MSHYDTLNVSNTATAEDIKKSYRRLASKHHPDKGGDTNEFQKIEEAYRVLSDTTSRAEYDAELSGTRNRNGMHFTWNNQDIDVNDLDSVFSNFGFGPRSPFGQGPKQRKNRDLRIVVNLSLKDTLAQQEKTLAVNTSNSSEMFNISIPRGIANGATIRYPGLGDNLFASLPRGDLYVNFNVVADPKFQVVNEHDLLTKIEINCFDAILGGETEVVGIDGARFVVVIPRGCQPNSKLRIKNQGLYKYNSNEKGHLLVEILVTLPKNLNEEQINIIKTLRDSQ